MIIGGLLVAAMTFQGCAPYWKVTRGQTRHSGRSQFSVPPRWMILHKGDFVLLTRHGPSLESILIMNHPIDHELAATQLRLQPGMLPHEIGEIVLNSLIATPGISKITLQNVRTFAVDGHKAIRVEVSYSIGEISRKAVSYSLVAANRFYELRYVAAERHYFAQGLPAFEELVRSFHLNR